MKREAKSPGLWLFKEEPDHYSFADLERDGSTIWNGISNSLARQNLWKVRKGDRVLYYHTGKEKAVVGEAKIVSEPYVEKDSADPKAVVVKIQAVRRWSNSVALTKIKEKSALTTWELVRLPRLSVVPVSPEQWQQVEQLSLGRE